MARRRKETKIQKAARELYHKLVGEKVEVWQGDILIEMERLDWDRCKYRELGYDPMTDMFTWEYERNRTISSLVAGY